MGLLLDSFFKSIFHLLCQMLLHLKRLIVSQHYKEHPIVRYISFSYAHILNITDILSAGEPTERKMPWRMMEIPEVY